MWTGWVYWYFCVCAYGCMYVWVGGFVLNCFALLCGAVWCGACVRARARVCVRVCVLVCVYPQQVPGLLSPSMKIPGSV